MRLIKINDYLYQFEFIEDEKNPNYTTNMTILLDNHKAVIIDAGFFHHAEEVKALLKSKGTTPEIVVFSHFHPDHIYGGKEFRDCKLIGSKYFKRNFDFFQKMYPENKFLEPKILVDDSYTFEFGKHKVSLIHTPGHSECSLTTVIDEKIAYIGDLVLATSDDFKILPYVCEGGSFEQHIDSLKKLIELNLDILLLAHGRPIYGSDKIKDELEDRIYYLNKVLDSKGQLSLKECLRSDISSYKATGLHRKNLKQL